MRIRWTEGADHYESLAVSLRAILAGCDQDRPYDELLAALGLGAAVVAAPDEALGSWCSYARDASLTTTAGLYGLGLRALHPPEAAHGLGDSAEYAGHFRDSYVPLIVRALEHDQPVLTWRGWPPPRDRLWGVVTARDAAMLVGHTLWHEGEPLPLTGAAHQVYIVEECRPDRHGTPTLDDLFAHVARQARAVWAGTWTAVTSVETGAAAYRAWQAALRDPPDSTAAPVPLHSQQSQAVRVHVAARSYLATWLRRVAERFADNRGELADRWADTCDRVARRLRPYESPEELKERLDQPDGVDEMCRAIDDVCRMESAAVAALESST